MNLDNLSEVKKLDSKDMLGSIEHLGKQVAEVYKISQSFFVPASFKKIQNIVVLGMGGSALGAHIIKSGYVRDLSVPVEIINGYNIPNYVGKNTLVICSSYSGSTEEPLSAVAQAKQVQAKIVVISSGGKLAQWAKKNSVPALIFSTTNNPCGSPRMGLGYSIFGQLIIFNKLGLIKFTERDYKKSLEVIEKNIQKFAVTVPKKDNQPKQWAQDLLERSIWYVGAQHLAGNAHVGANQMNENAKRFSGYFVIPELNHHLMEGLPYPADNSKKIAIVLVESKIYSPKIQKRFTLTKGILDKNNIKYLSYICESKSVLDQICEMLVVSSYFSFYSAIAQGIDPTAIPFVDFFKEQLKK